MGKWGGKVKVFTKCIVVTTIVDNMKGFFFFGNGHILEFLCLCQFSKAKGNVVFLVTALHLVYSIHMKI